MYTIESHINECRLYTRPKRYRRRINEMRSFVEGCPNGASQNDQDKAFCAQTKSAGKVIGDTQIDPTFWLRALASRVVISAKRSSAHQNLVTPSGCDLNLDAVPAKRSAFSCGPRVVIKPLTPEAYRTSGVSRGKKRNRFLEQTGHQMQRDSSSHHGAWNASPTGAHVCKYGLWALPFAAGSL